MVRGNGQLTRNLLGAVVGRGAGIALGLATMPAYLRFLPDRGVLGAWFTVLTVFNLVVVFDLGVGNGLRNRIQAPLAAGDARLARQLIASTFAVSVVIATVGFAAGAVVILRVDWNEAFDTPESLVAPGEFDRAMLMLLTGVVIQLVLKNTIALLYALGRNNVVVAMSITSSGSLLVFLLVQHGGSLAGNLLSLSVANVVFNTVPGAVVTLWLLRSRALLGPPRPRDVERGAVRSVLSVGSAFLAIQLGLVVISSTDPMLISGLVGPSFVVEYQAYVRIFGIFSTAFTLVTQPVWSAVAQANVRGDNAWIRSMSRVMVAAALCGTVVAAALVPALPWVFRTWLGSGVVPVSVLTGLLFAALTAAEMFVLSLTCIANAINALRPQLIWTLVGAAAKVPCTFIALALLPIWEAVVLAHLLVLLPLAAAQSLALRTRLAEGPALPVGGIVPPGLAAEGSTISP